MIIIGKEFIEYTSDNGKMPYKKSDVLLCLTQYAKYYIKEKHNLISDIDSDVRDNSIVDLINYIGSDNWVNFALSTNDLYCNNIINYEQVDPQCLLTIAFNYCSYYTFKIKVTNLKDIYINDEIKVLIDFLNFISKAHDYDRIFSLKDLYDNFKTIQYKNEMEQLKSFLELTGIYSRKLINGLDIDYLFNTECLIDSPKYSLRKRINNYTNPKINKNNLYALAYAYEKVNIANKKEPHNKIIMKKISEMKEK